MRLLRSFQHTLKNKLSLSSKILLKRLYAGSTRPFGHINERLQKSKPLAQPHTPPPWRIREPEMLLDSLSLKRDSARETKRQICTSIVIPVFNKVDFTFECLQSLLREIDLNGVEVIVVDNASTDETSEMLAHFGDFICVTRNQQNLGFVDACNQGAGIAQGKYLVFLNNDTTVLPGWLDNLLLTVESDSSVGAVGSMFLYPDYKIQEAGAIVWKSGEAFHYGWRKPSDDRRYNFAREVDYCSAASLLIRREIFQTLGGFDRRYAPAYYEDVDLCFGVRSLGFKVVYQPLSRVIHYEGVTAGRDTSAGTKQYQIINHPKFYEKWHEKLEREHYKNDPSLAERASNRKRGPQVIVFDDRVPTPDRDAGSGRMFHILKLLASLGQTVFLSLKPLPEYEQLLWREGIETASVVDYRRLIKKRDFQIAILSRPEVAEALIRSVRRADRGIKIVFDMVDAYFIRLGRQHRVTGNHHLAEESRRYMKLELDLARASDQVWCNSSEDKKAVSKYIPAERIVVVPTIHVLQNRGKSFEERDGLLFVGNFSHSPNSDAVHFFMKDVFPIVKKSLPSIVFYIVGSSATREITAYNSENVKIMGFVPDINPLCQGARVFVAPLRFGAGTKGKIGDAMAYGLPVVTTSIGAEGFGITSGEQAMIADDPQRFAENVLHVYRNRELWQRLADRGYRHIEQNFTPEAVGRTIELGLRSLGALDQKDD